MAAPLLTLALLGVLAAQALSRPSPQDAEPYHQRVLEAVESIPYRVGDWVGADVRIPREAQALLRPNALFGRRFDNLLTGESVTLLLVQCRTARDMQGHWPPNCYPANGYAMIDERPQTWHVGDLVIDGYVYNFTTSTMDDRPTTIVFNFLIMPDGRLVPDMRTVREVAADYLRHFYGAAQVQMLMSSEMPEERRYEVFEQFMDAITPVIDVIRAGGE